MTLHINFIEVFFFPTCDLFFSKIMIKSFSGGEVGTDDLYDV